MCFCHHDILQHNYLPRYHNRGKLGSDGAVNHKTDRIGTNVTRTRVKREYPSASIIRTGMGLVNLGSKKKQAVSGHAEILTSTQGP